MKPEYESIPSKDFKNRCLKVYKLKCELGDRLIFCSDGVTQSGLGGGRLKLGLRREGLIVLLQDNHHYIRKFQPYIHHKSANRF